MKPQLIAAVVWALSVCAPAISAQAPKSPESPSTQAPRPVAANPLIRRIEFNGLRRIAPATLRQHIGSREGLPLDPAQIEEDVRALDRLGWFDVIRVLAPPLEVWLASAAPPLGWPKEGAGVRLIFELEERPFLKSVEYRGSRALPKERIAALFVEKGVTLKLAAPVNRTELRRGARLLENALADLGHPRAEARVRLVAVPTAAVRAVFEISDGPRVRVAAVNFAGNVAFSDKALRKQMQRVAPGALLAGLRGKTVFTPQRLAEDVARVESFYRSRGYAEARLGSPEVNLAERPARRWFPWPKRVTRPVYQISLPVEEGTFYRLEKAEVEGVPPGREKEIAATLRGLAPQAPYSEERLLRARQRLERIARDARPAEHAGRTEVELTRELHREAATARVTFRLREVEPYIVRRIEFLGHHRFTDRYYRRRVLLKEGEPFDAEKLERGLAGLARTGFIRPVTENDLHVRLDPASRTADVTIRFEEAGRQRISLVGGAGRWGSTLGVAYSVFDLLGGEELLTTHLEGGPGALNVFLNIAKEGLFGTRASLGLTLFHNVIRPNLPGAGERGRLFTSRSSGLGLSGNYPLTAKDTLGWNYELARSSSELPVAQALPGVPAGGAQTRTARSALGLSWSREGAARDRAERLDAAASVSGGWLGGDEKLLRSSLEYTRVHADPLSGSRNAWAWRGYVNGVSGYGGEPLLLHERLFAGEQLLRGFRAGELAPYTVTTASQPDGAPASRAQSAGATLVAAVNTEYRVALEPAVKGAEAAAFIDAGAGWLLPRWLSGSAGDVLHGTNGLLRSSAGLEFRFQLPAVRQTVRVYYAFNPVRLARSLLLPDGSAFHPPDRCGAFGWALGTLF